ncbi:MAG: NADH-quinone oxidoreductase subunit NuoE [Candidatus Delongbacteria bacterium]|nr:NADH-quinone oxidoreductase subunit NuoE [Candidatus Delongbacteria bacterium]MBN2835478.1 NADH-quinone oxidoreductase subunit NuoE [Candidatus Delongbacteria bacterium]
MRIERNSVEKNCLVSYDEVDLSLIDKLIEKYSHVKGNVIPVLQGIQNIYGYLPGNALKKASEELKINLNDLFGVATFYAQFRLKPVGKHIIKVCHGTACHVQNAKKITETLMMELKVKDGETTDDRLFTLESVACLGCCSLAPVMMIGEETYGKLTGDKAVKIIRDIRKSES